MEAALWRPVPGKEVDEEVAEDETREGEDEEERRVLEGVSVECLPRVVDEVVDGGARGTRDEPRRDGEEQPGET